MADGDLSQFGPAININGDTVTAEITSGPGAGQVWRIRDVLIDLHEREGADRFLGQGDLLALRAWLDEWGPPYELLQLGVDQFGRLVGDIRAINDASNWSVVAANQGRGQIGTISRSGSTGRVSFPQRRPGTGFGGDLVVDLTRP